MNKYTYKNYTIKIVPDDDPINPRENDNLGTMVCGHKQYNLGDVQVHTPEELRNELKQHDVGNGTTLALPLYLLDHSGLRISINPFQGEIAKWDSGYIGFIYVSAEKIRSEFSVKRISPKLRKRILNILIAEVEEYNSYISGDTWGYKVCREENGIEVEIDSCYGFYGSGVAAKEAESYVDNLVEV